MTPRDHPNTRFRSARVRQRACASSWHATATSWSEACGDSACGPPTSTTRCRRCSWWPRAFLFGTAVRVCSTRRRAARRHPEELSASADEHPRAELDPERLVALAEARRLLGEILAGMCAEFRAVFVLAELDELPVREIARTLGVPEGTVNSRLRTAREKFQAGVRRVAARDAFTWQRRAQSPPS